MYKILITQDEYDVYKAVLSLRRHFLGFGIYFPYKRALTRGLIDHTVGIWKRKYNVQVIDDRA